MEIFFSFHSCIKWWEINVKKKYFVMKCLFDPLNFELTAFFCFIIIRESYWVDSNWIQYSAQYESAVKNFPTPFGMKYEVHFDCALNIQWTTEKIEEGEKELLNMIEWTFKIEKISIFIKYFSLSIAYATNVWCINLGMMSTTSLLTKEENNIEAIYESTFFILVSAWMVNEKISMQFNFKC